LTGEGLYHYLVKGSYYPWATVLEVETGRKFRMLLHRRDDFEIEDFEECNASLLPCEIVDMIRYWNERGFAENGKRTTVKLESQLHRDRVWYCYDLFPNKIRRRRRRTGHSTLRDGVCSPPAT